MNFNYLLEFINIFFRTKNLNNFLKTYIYNNYNYKYISICLK